MKHTDHSRQFLVWLDEIVAKAKRDPRHPRVRRGAVADYIAQGTKFLLPGNGIVLEDPYLRGIDETLPLSLPFPIVVIEFPDPVGILSKTIVVLKEDAALITMTVTALNSLDGTWGTLAPVIFDRNRYIERNEKGQPDFIYGFPPDVPEEAKVNHQLYYHYIVVFLQFINVMACKNVSYEKSPPSKVKMAMRKGPIPYDEYKVLTTFVTPREKGNKGKDKQDAQPVKQGLGGSHASPREHLRRGHIVRMSTGKVYWRSATVVMAGSGGRIEKAYALK